MVRKHYEVGRLEADLFLLLQKGGDSPLWSPNTNV